jgi:Flp pilus assembly protein TadG
MPGMSFMRRIRAVLAREDDGAVALLVAILFGGGVLLGMAALVIDVGALYGERRQLQNSADAAALSLAQDCAARSAACTTSPGNVSGIVNSNDSADGTSAVAGVCVTAGGVSTGLCSSASSTLADCLPLPAGAQNYVEVRTRTRTASGGTLLPPVFAETLAGGYSGTAVGACSRVAWGGASGASSAIPLTVSNCEFQHYVGNPPTNFAPPPPYPPWPAATWEHTIWFHDTTNALAGSCPAGPAGSDDPISGGFGWLQSTSCEVTSTVANWFDASPGTSPGSDCRAAEFAASYGQLVDIPIYDGTNGLNGANGKYHIKGYAAFVLTGYYLGGSYKKKSLITGDYPCGRTPTTGDERCISGFFTQDLTPTSGVIGGTDMGVTVIQMTG